MSLDTAVTLGRCHVDTHGWLWHHPECTTDHDAIDVMLQHAALSLTDVERRHAVNAALQMQQQNWAKRTA